MDSSLGREQKSKDLIVLAVLVVSFYLLSQKNKGLSAVDFL
jgi:hypothetical protein